MLDVEKGFEWLAKRLNDLGMIGIVFLAALICCDIFRRLVYQPIVGVYDIDQMVIGAAIAFTVPYGIISKANVFVGMVVDRFPARYQDIIETVTLFFSVVLFAVITVETIRGGITAFRLSETTPTIYIPRHYLFWMISLGIGLGGLRLLGDFVISFRKAVGK